MGHLVGLIVVATVATALLAVAIYGLVTLVLAVLIAARARHLDPLAEELDEFLARLLGPRDQMAASPAAPGGRSRPGARRSARRQRKPSV